MKSSYRNLTRNVTLVIQRMITNIYIQNSLVVLHFYLSKIVKFSLQSVYLQIVKLLIPTPWIGNMSTRPFIEYGPTSCIIGAL